MVGLDGIRVYSARRQKMVAEYIVTFPIMDLCLAAKQKLGMRLSRKWREQPALDILGIRAGNAAT